MIIDQIFINSEFLIIMILISGQSPRALAESINDRKVRKYKKINNKLYKCKFCPFENLRNVMKIRVIIF